MFYGKATPGRDDMILVAVSLDPHSVQEAAFEMPLWEWKLPDNGALEVEDLMRGQRFTWHGKRPAHAARSRPSCHSRSGASRRKEAGHERAVAPNSPQLPVAQDPLWYKDAIIYQLHVKSFFDANNDGIGDFPGLISKLDYIAELGVNTIWLLPFYPSPRRDDGYDIADYRGVHPEYGTLADVKRFIAAAHERGMRVITELVINHTSDQHPWFQRARTRQAGLAGARLLRLVGHRPEIRRHAHHLHRHRAVELDLGPGRQRLLLAPLLFAPARPELRQSRRCSRRCCA